MVSLREAGSEDDIKCLTYIKEDALHDTLVINPYIPLKPQTNYTLCICGIIQTDEFDVEGNYMFDTSSQEFINYNDDFNVVDLDTEGNIVFETVEAAFDALDGFFYATNINLMEETHGFNPYDPFIIEYTDSCRYRQGKSFRLSQYFGGFLTLSNEGPPGETTKSEKNGKWLFNQKGKTSI